MNSRGSAGRPFTSGTNASAAEGEVQMMNALVRASLQWRQFSKFEIFVNLLLHSRIYNGVLD
jgi:hypothetical protein